MSETRFRNILRAWHNNNGIHGFGRYFDWGGYSGIYNQVSKDSGKSVRALIIEDYDSTKNDFGFRDSYVSEWWYVWRTHDICRVFFRSDGSIYYWLLDVVAEDGYGIRNPEEKLNGGEQE
jgi:hypothetical protein